MTQPVDKQAVAAAFGRAAANYDRFADLQRISGERLIAHLPALKGRRVLDAGCGTGWFSRHWMQQGCEVTALDLSPLMLAHAQRHRTAHHFVEGDIEHIPLSESRFDLVWSNLAVQWCTRLADGLAELYRVTRPGGVVGFSTLAAGSLHELHTAWQSVDARAHANQFLAAEAIAAACPTPHHHLHQETVTLHFPDALSAMRSLKGIGATHLHDGRDGGLLTRQRLARLEAAWPRDAHGLTLSYHLIFGVLHRD